LGMGGDYGFAWTPHGDYAKELTFFVNEIGFCPADTPRCATKTGAEVLGCSPADTLTCARKTGAEILARDKKLGTLQAGKLADVLVVDGDPLHDIRILEDRSRFIAVLQGGIVKAGRLASSPRCSCPPRPSTTSVRRGTMPTTAAHPRRRGRRWRR